MDAQVEVDYEFRRDLLFPFQKLIAGLPHVAGEPDASVGLGEPVENRLDHH